MADSYYTYDLGQYYAITPQNASTALLASMQDRGAFKMVRGTSYNSHDNPDFLSVQQLHEAIEAEFSIGDTLRQTVYSS